MTAEYPADELPAAGRPPGLIRSLVWWCPTMLLALVALVGLVRLALPLGGRFSSGGDVAFLELQVRQTLHGVVAVGPYSRFGWHDPGPTMFYLFAPLYWLTGEDSRSLFLSSWLLNMGSGVAAAVLIRRRAGAVAGWACAVVLLLFLADVGFDRLIDPWNPSVLALPMLLLAVAASAAADGDVWGLLGVTAAATLEVQTYIATIPVAAVWSLLAVAGWLWHRYSCRGTETGPASSGRRVRAAKAGMVAVASAVVVLWALPLGQQVWGTSGNLGRLLSFELHPPASAGATHHSLHEALSAVSDYGTAFGFGEPKDLAAHSSRLALAGGYATLGVIAAAFWASRRNRFMAALAMTTPIGLGVAVVAATRVTGPVYGYMFWWCRMLPLPAIVAGGSAAAGFLTVLLRPRRGMAPLAAGFGLAALAGAAVPASRTVMLSPSSSYPDSPGARQAARQIEALVGDRRRVFTVQVAGEGFSDGPLILTLVKDGYRFHLSPGMDLYPGDTGRPSGGLTFTVAHGTDPIPSVSASPPISDPTRRPSG